MTLSLKKFQANNLCSPGIPVYRHRVSDVNMYYNLGMASEITNLDEKRQAPENIKPKYDALLLHGYWMTQKGKHTTPSLRTHFAARAAALAWDNGKGAGKIVLDLGHLWGPNYPTEARVITDMLVNKYHVPKNAIILREGASSTYGEVKTALELANKNNWTRVLDVAFAHHHMTIPGLYKSKELRGFCPPGLNVDYKSVEEILERDDRRVSDVRRKFSRRYAMPYFAYEGLKWLLMHRPGFKYEPLEKANKKQRTKPINDFKYWRIDKFKLPGK